jgi:hypothetical protein
MFIDVSIKQYNRKLIRRVCPFVRQQLRVSFYSFYLFAAPMSKDLSQSSANGKGKEQGKEQNQSQEEQLAKWTDPSQKIKRPEGLTALAALSSQDHPSPALPISDILLEAITHDKYGKRKETPDSDSKGRLDAHQLVYLATAAQSAAEQQPKTGTGFSSETYIKTPHAEAASEAETKGFTDAKALPYSPFRMLADLLELFSAGQLAEAMDVIKKLAQDRY